MARERLSILIPEASRQFVEDRVASEGYGSVSEYFRELIRLDQRLELDRLDAAVMRNHGNNETASRPMMRVVGHDITRRLKR